MSIAPKPLTLEENPLWKEACDLAEYMYSKLAEFPDEEKWATSSKLRSAANDLMYFTAQAIGNASDSNAEYDWSQVRRHASALKTMYRFAHRQKFIEVEPEIMNRLTTFMKLVDEALSDAHAQIEASNLEEQARWQKRYSEHKEMQS